MTAIRHLIAAIALTAAAAGSALAQEAGSDSWLQAAQGTKSRAEVSAELTAARQSGLSKAWSAGYMEPVRNPALRAQVQARTLPAIQSGELKAINSEVYGDGPGAAVRLSQASR
jgi:hypothetical protein